MECFSAIAAVGVLDLRCPLSIDERMSVGRFILNVDSCMPWLSQTDPIWLLAFSGELVE